MRNTEDKVYACTYADIIGSDKEGDREENEGREDNAKRRERTRTKPPR